MIESGQAVAIIVEREVTSRRHRICRVCGAWGRSLPLSHDPSSIPQGDLVRRPLQASRLERSDRNGQWVDRGEVQLDAAADLAPDLDRVGDARRHRRDLLRAVPGQVATAKSSS